MALYFFDTNDGRSFSRDTKGIECADLEAVRRTALAALPDMAFEIIPDGNEVELSVGVRDAEGRPVLTARMTLSVIWPGASPERRRAE